MERGGSFCTFFWIPYNNHKETTVINSRYHTNQVSFNVINSPSTPVKPQRKTAALSWSKAFFISRNNGLSNGFFNASAIIFEQTGPTELDNSQYAFFNDAFAHFGLAILAIFKLNGHFFYAEP